MTTKQTSTPWGIRGDNTIYQLATNDPIALVYRRGTAELIVKAVNSYDDMLEEIENAQGWLNSLLETRGKDMPDEEREILVMMYDSMAAAIAKAKGEA